MSCVGVACLLASVLDFGAVPDDGLDDGPALQAALDAVAATGGVLTFAPGQYDHAGQLYLRGADHVEIDGRGAVLHATHPINAALTIQDSLDVTVRTLELTGSGVTRSQADRSCGVLVYRTSELVLRSLRVHGFAGAGVMLQQASDFVIQGNIVHDTLADAIHITNQSRDGSVRYNTTYDSGDDGIAFVGYAPPKNDGPLVNLEAVSNSVLGNLWGRGITVEGVNGALVEDNYIESTSSAGIIVAAGPAGQYNHHPVNDVVVRRNAIVNANWNPTVTHGGMLVSASVGYPITNLLIENNDFVDTIGAGSHLRVSGSTVGVVVNGNQFYDADSSHRAWTFYAGAGATAAGNLYNGVQTNGGKP